MLQVKLRRYAKIRQRYDSGIEGKIVTSFFPFIIKYVYRWQLFGCSIYLKLSAIVESVYLPSMFADITSDIMQ